MRKFNTALGIDMDEVILDSYLSSLINQFYKILPMHESGQPTLAEYEKSLLCELMGCRSLVLVLGKDSFFSSLLFILQFLIDNDCETKVVRREVFKAISLCKKLRNKYCNGGVNK